MEQYIPKASLLAEINKLKGKISDGSSYCNGWQHALRMLELSLDTLEVKGVDMEKEEERIWKDFNMAECRLSKDDLEEIAKHFFELGMSVSNKAQKGEKV